MQLRNTVGIVTGASRGLGLHIADQLAAKGVDLVLAARTPEPLEAAAERVRRHGTRIVAAPTDITKRTELKKLVKIATDELGPVDLLVNNAGIAMVGYFETLDQKDIDAAIATNLGALIALTRLVVPGMVERGRGHVVNVSSAAGKAARPYASVYSGTKHGVVGFSWGLRAELAGRGVEVSVVCPSYVTGEGMFAAREQAAGKVPGPLKPTTPEKVAAETVKSIEKNRAEVVVGPPLVRGADVLHAFSPRAAMWLGRRTGLYRFLRKEATGDGS